MSFESSANRLWKRLSLADRQVAAEAFFNEPPQDLLGTALGAIVQARHLRPQVARSLGTEERARILATVLDVGEPLASTLLICLHLGDRRALLTTFLDAVGLPHENGLLKEDADAVEIGHAKVSAGVDALLAAHPKEQVRVYLNTLWQQDPEHWAALEKISEEPRLS